MYINSHVIQWLVVSGQWLGLGVAEKQPFKIFAKMHFLQNYVDLCENKIVDFREIHNMCCKFQINFAKLTQKLKKMSQNL